MLSWLDISWFNGAVLYLCLWWVCIFPIINRGSTHDRAPVAGHEPAAPDKLNLWPKLALTSAISFVLWWVAVFLIYHPSSPFGGLVG